MRQRLPYAIALSLLVLPSLALVRLAQGEDAPPGQEVATMAASTPEAAGVPPDPLYLLPTAPPTTTTVPSRPVVVLHSRAASRAVVVPSSCGGWADLIARHFPAEQVGKACRVMMCESGGNPTARSRRSSASGLFQFLRSTWQGVTGRTDEAWQATPDEQTEAAARLWASSGWRPWVCA